MNKNKWFYLISMVFICTMWFMCASSKPDQFGPTKAEEKKKVDELLDQDRTDEQRASLL